jgi:hypothetical protein
MFITVLDLMIAVRDTDATTYAKNYWWWFKKRFDPNYHLYMFKKRTKYDVLPKPFELPKDGVLGKKTQKGWMRDAVKTELPATNDATPVEELEAISK